MIVCVCFEYFQEISLARVGDYLSKIYSDLDLLIRMEPDMVVFQNGK